jgi:3-hydroxyisobutyrate dehydrogenase-like beta-hydroxyacid dehydrogenase
MMVERVGIVGMGLMGQAFIANMRKSQIAVQGFDLDPVRMDQLREQGGQPVDSPAAAARGVDHVVTSLPNSDVARAVMLSSNGIADSAREGLIVCDTTTARPEDSERLANDLAERGIRFVDAAVSGTSAMAAAGDLVVIAGGEQRDFEACRPVLASFSRAAYHMGPAGSGARTKLVVNLVLAGNRLALAEGLVLGEKVGLDRENLLAVLQDGASGSKTMVDKGPKMIKADYATQSLISNVLKDSRLMLEQGQKFGAPLLMTALWSQLIQAAYQKGYGDKDVTVFIEILRDLAGLDDRAAPDA